MKIPEYVTKTEVKRVCKELKIRDWTTLKKAEVTAKEAAKILSIVGVPDIKIGVENFKVGLEVELEHGTRYPDANVTNNHPLLTGKIVIAHLKEMLDYYKRLDVAEIEGDLHKALVAKDNAKLGKYYKKLAQAKLVLSQSEAKALK